MSEKVWEKYTEIFAEERHAYDLPIEKVSEVFKKVYGDEHSDSFVTLMASTFKALVNYAGLNSIKKTVSPELVAADEHVNGVGENVFDESDGKGNEGEDTKNIDIQEQEHEHNPEKNTAEEEEVDEDNPFEIENDDIISEEDSKGETDTNNDTESEKSGKNKETDYLMDLINETPKEEKKEKDMDTDVISNGAEQHEITAEKKDAFLKKALVKRAELLQKLNRDEDALNALDQLVKYFEKSDDPGKEEVLSKSLIQKAEILEKLGNDEETLEAYDKYINRYFK